MDEMVFVLLICLFGGGFFISFVILVGRGIRKTIYRETKLLRESKEKEIELMQAQIDYYNSLKQKESCNYAGSDASQTSTLLKCERKEQ